VKKIIQFLIGIGISSVFIYLSFSKMNFDEIFRSILSVKIRYVILSTLVSTASIAIRAVRWKYIIPVKNINNNWNIISANYIGFMMNNIFPAKLGDVTRAYILGDKEGISKTSVFASVVIERFIDIISILLIFLIASIFFTNLNYQVLRYFILKIDLRLFLILIFVFTLLTIIAYSVMLKYKRQFTINIIEKILVPLPHMISDKIITLLKKIQSGIGFSSHNKALLKFIIYTLIYWVLIILGIMILFYSFNFSSQLNEPLLTALVITITSAIASSIPLTPANIGTMQFAVITGLTLFNVNIEQAGAYSIISHASSWILQVLIGLIFLIVSGMNNKGKLFYYHFIDKKIIN
jgi:glycosyltransferase 2 family protein